ncbi:ATPase [Mucilaginibacter sp. PPCGB 2223]|uniref:SRPBCC family protein n=1 Tax=Mucilaginibacter sp. PPCGB 2223 TaxID=1886027 RepID=UPI0008247C72|nr:SRPBCC domain-containing protein [Mucilaginibacter sp. PPCGB 2223]OCX52801.1 ATPase [Mucilaginibacter sp. PPCGB 2223]
MKNEPFVIERTYNAPVEKVWRAITDRDQMALWYFQLKEFKPEVGFVFEFEGGPPEKTYLHRCEITEVIPNKKLTHSWAYVGYAGRSFVSWELFDEGGKTRVKLTHTGLETFPADNADFARKNFEMGWTEITGKMLKEFVEKA